MDHVKVKIKMQGCISKCNVLFGRKELQFRAYTQTLWSSVFPKNKEKVGGCIKKEEC